MSPNGQSWRLVTRERDALQIVSRTPWSLRVIYFLSMHGKNESRIAQGRFLWVRLGGDMNNFSSYSVGQKFVHGHS